MILRLDQGSSVDRDKPSRRSCEHCGSPFLPQGDEVYCCNGCAHVARLIREEGLTQFYRDKVGITLPVKDTPFESHDWQTLTQTTERAQAVGDTARGIDLEIQGMVCRACAWLAEQVIERESPKSRFEIDVESRRIRFTWSDDSMPNFSTIGSALQDYGFILKIPETPKTKPPSLLPLAIAAAFALSALALLAPWLLQIDQDLGHARLFTLTGALAALISVLISAHFTVRQIKYLKR